MHRVRELPRLSLATLYSVTTLLREARHQSSCPCETQGECKLPNGRFARRACRSIAVTTGSRMHVGAHCRTLESFWVTKRQPRRTRAQATSWCLLLCYFQRERAAHTAWNSSFSILARAGGSSWPVNASTEEVTQVLDGMGEREGPLRLA